MPDDGTLNSDVPITTDLSPSAPATDTAAGSPPSPAAVPPPDAAPSSVTPEPDLNAGAADALTQIANMGITPQNAHEFVNTATQYQHLMGILRDPQALLDGLRQNSPDEYDKLLNVASDRWLEKHPEPEADGQVSGVVNAELSAMRRELQELKQGYTAAQQQARVNAAASTYTATLNSLIDKLPGLNDFEKRSIGALVGHEVAKIPGASGRIAQGTMLDLPKALQNVYNDFKATRSNGSREQIKAREAVAAAGQTISPPAAEGVNGPTVVPDDMWDTTSQDYARLLNSQ